MSGLSERVQDDALDLAAKGLMLGRVRTALDGLRRDLRGEDADGPVNVVKVGNEPPERDLGDFDLAGDLRALPDQT
jgi:hypothetical protein